MKKIVGAIIPDMLADQINKELGLDIEKAVDLKKLLIKDEYREYRTVLGNRIIGGNEYLNCTEYIYHKLLEDNEKCSIYGSVFEIGNPTPIPDGLLKGSKYFSYLEETYGGSAEDQIKLLKKLIKTITGIDFITFAKVDKSQAYKVLTLLYRLSYIENIKLPSFLSKNIPTKKTNFEYRSSYPMRTKKAIKNSSVLSELQSHLTFSMPEEHRKHATHLLLNITEQGNNFGQIIHRELSGQFEVHKNGVNYSPENVHAALLHIKDMGLSNDNNVAKERLDFVLYCAIEIRIYEARISSNRLMSEFIYRTPLNLQSLINTQYLNNEHCDLDVVAHLLNYKENSNEYIKLKRTISTYGDKAQRIADHFYDYNFLHEERVPLKPLNMQIIKAIIHHDSQLNLKIPSTVIGDTNLPESPTAYLKSKNNIPNDFPEALSMYWNLRNRYATKLALSNEVEVQKRIELMRNSMELDADKLLITLLSKPTLENVKCLPKFMLFAAKFLGYPIAPTESIDFTNLANVPAQILAIDAANPKIQAN